MSWKSLQSDVTKVSAVEWIIGGAGLLLAAAVIGIVVWKLQGKSRAVKVRWAINVGTLMATAVQASGMWHFFGDVMHMSMAYKIVMFPFMELLLLAFGLKALEKAEAAGNWFIYAGMLWVLALSSGSMSASDSSGFREGMFRIMVAAIVAVLWTLDLLDLWIQARKKKAEEEGKTPEAIRWRFSPREIGVRLGLATAADSSLADLDANRHLERYLRVVDRRRALERLISRDPDKASRLHRRLTRITGDEVKAKARLERHARLHADPSVLMGELGAEAVTQAREHLGIAQVQQALREAQEETAAAREEAATQAAEVARLAALLDEEKAAAAADADGQLTSLALELEAARSELEKVRRQAEAATTEVENHDRAERNLVAELASAHRERARLEKLREEEGAAARARIADLERSLDTMRATIPAPGLPARVQATASVQRKPSDSEGPRAGSKKALFLQELQNLIDTGDLRPLSTDPKERTAVAYMIAAMDHVQLNEGAARTYSLEFFKQATGSVPQQRTPQADQVEAANGVSLGSDGPAAD